MSGKVLSYMFAIVFVTILASKPLVVRKEVPTVQHDTVALRVDTVRVIERPGAFGTCALPAVVVAVQSPEHRTGTESTPHGHYSVATGDTPLKVVAIPMDAKPGDVVCVLGDQ